jgi:hypothetical protein
MGAVEAFCLRDLFLYLVDARDWATRPQNKQQRTRDSIHSRFGYPWFISHDRFFVSAGADFPHSDDPEHAYAYDFYFQIRNAGRTVKLVKVDPQKSEPVKFPKSYPPLEPWDEPAEPLDRSKRHRKRIDELVGGFLQVSGYLWDRTLTNSHDWKGQLLVSVSPLTEAE